MYAATSYANDSASVREQIDKYQRRANKLLSDHSDLFHVRPTPTFRSGTDRRLRLRPIRRTLFDFVHRADCLCF